MTTETPRPTEPEIEIQSTSWDLQAELQANLESEFTASLMIAGTLPRAVSKSLVDLLNTNAPTATD